MHFAHPRELVESTGTELGTSRWQLVDQARIDGFAEHTGDRQWIHTDPQRAAHGPFGTTIAHGYLTLSLVPMMLRDVVDVGGATAVVNYGLNKVRFPAPVAAGRRVRGTIALLGASERGAAVEAVFGITIAVEGGSRPACVAEVVVLYS